MCLKALEDGSVTGTRAWSMLTMLNASSSLASGAHGIFIIQRDKQEFDVLWLSEECDLTKVSPWHEQIRVSSQLVMLQFARKHLREGFDVWTMQAVSVASGMFHKGNWIPLNEGDGAFWEERPDHVTRYKETTRIVREEKQVAAGVIWQSSGDGDHFRFSDLDWTACFSGLHVFGPSHHSEFSDKDPGRCLLPLHFFGNGHSSISDGDWRLRLWFVQLVESHHHTRPCAQKLSFTPLMFQMLWQDGTLECWRTHVCSSCIAKTHRNTFICKMNLFA